MGANGESAFLIHQSPWSLCGQVSSLGRYENHDAIRILAARERPGKYWTDCPESWDNRVR